MADRETENAIVIGTFLEENNLKGNNLMIAKFKALVKYSPANISDVTDVMIKKDTYSYGDIEISETEIINPSKVHTGFMRYYSCLLYTSDAADEL